MNNTEQDMIEQSTFVQPQTSEKIIEELAEILATENAEDLPNFEGVHQEAIEEFLEPENVSELCSVYLLTCKDNGKVYVGQTWAYPVENRMGKNGGKYANSPYLYYAIQKHGVDAFYYTVLDRVADQEVANTLEAQYITQYNSRDHNIGYNIREGGKGGKHSQISKEKISATLTRLWNEMTPEQQIQRATPIMNWWKGKKRGPHTEEWKANNSKMMIERHATQGHPMQGKHHTEEAKAAISAANKGMKMPIEAVKKSAKSRQMPIAQENAIIEAYNSGMIISDLCDKLGVKTSAVYRVVARNGLTLRGQKNVIHKPHTEEAKQKQSASQTKMWAARKANK